LSLAEPRKTAYRQLDLWLDDYLSTDSADASTSSGKG
jgi:hypothetical protein